MNILTVNLPVQHAGVLDRRQALPSPAVARARGADRTAAILLHAFRRLGLMFLAPGATCPAFPRSLPIRRRWDLLAAVLALIAIRRRARRASRACWSRS